MLGRDGSAHPGDATRVTPSGSGVSESPNNSMSCPRLLMLLMRYFLVWPRGSIRADLSFGSNPGSRSTLIGSSIVRRAVVGALGSDNNRQKQNKPRQYGGAGNDDDSLEHLRHCMVTQSKDYNHRTSGCSRYGPLLLVGGGLRGYDCHPRYYAVFAEE